MGGGILTAPSMPSPRPSRPATVGRVAAGLLIVIGLLVAACGSGKDRTAAEAEEVPPASRFVSPGGSDSGSCTAELPCQSLDRAYHVAEPGEIVELAAGVPNRC